MKSDLNMKSKTVFLFGKHEALTLQFYHPNYSIGGIKMLGPGMESESELCLSEGCEV